MPKQKTKSANIPMRSVGPIKLAGPEVSGEIVVPLATYESPIWYTVHRGTRVSMLADGIKAVIIDEQMTRSITLEGPDAITVAQINAEINNRQQEIAAIVSQTSRFATFKRLDSQQVGNLLYLRLAITTGDAAGHNMVTKAADAMMNWLLQQYSVLRYVSVSGNFCTDKKTSSVNSILGRGKRVVAEITIPKEICQWRLRTTPQQIADLHVKKNLIGSNIAGSLQTANAHFANILLAFYLATGQDAANIVEASQGIVHAECQQDDLYFSVTLPNIIVGTVGSGKDLPFVQDNLTSLGCLEQRESGHNARRLAIICAATVLCGELSLLAALTNPGELITSHMKLERSNMKK